MIAKIYNKSIRFRKEKKMTTQNLNKLPGTIAVPMDKIRITIYWTNVKYLDTK